MLGPIDHKFHGHGKNNAFFLYEYIIKQCSSFCKYTNISIKKKRKKIKCQQYTEGSSCLWSWDPKNSSALKYLDPPLWIIWSLLTAKYLYFISDAENHLHENHSDWKRSHRASAISAVRDERELTRRGKFDGYLDVRDSDVDSENFLYLLRNG